MEDKSPAWHTGFRYAFIGERYAFIGEWIWSNPYFPPTSQEWHDFIDGFNARLETFRPQTKDK